MKSNRNLPAFTLIEVMIVLSIIASVMAIAWPRLRRLSDQTELREAAQVIKSVLSEARDRSINEGIEIRFVYQLGSQQYRIEPESTFILPSTGSLAEMSGPNSTPIDTDPSPDGADLREQQSATVFTDQDLDGDLGNTPIDDASVRQLPDSIMFVSTATPEADVRDPQTPSSASSGVRPEALDSKDLVGVGIADALPTTASESISFYPDGRSLSAQIRVYSSEIEKVIPIKLRGMTGSASIGPAETMAMEGNALEENTDSPDSTNSVDAADNSFGGDNADETLDERR